MGAAWSGEPVGVTVAVDIGGSGLRLQVRPEDGAARPVRSAPGARLDGQGVDVDALVRDAALLLSQETTEPVDALCWSMRGLLFLADKAAVLERVREGTGARRTAVVSDAVANLVGAVGDLRPGAVVAAGTGAVAFGTDFGAGERGTWRRVDGWGHVLGDHGSAARLGLAGAQAVLRALDGAGPRTSLEATLVEHLGRPDSWPRAVMTRADAPELLAGLAPTVSTAALDGDVVAAGLCREAGEGLATSLLAAAAGLHDPLLCATGGLLASIPVRTALEATVVAAGHELTPPLGGALEGAARLAAMLGEGLDVPTHPTYLVVG